MNIKYYNKIILLFVFVFVLINCTKKQEKNKVKEPEIKETINNENNITNKKIEYIYNDEINNKKYFEYRGIPNYNYDDIKNLLLIKNKKKVDNVLDFDFHFGASLEYLSYIKLDIDIIEGETWFSSWHIPDSISASYCWIYLHIIKDDNIIKTYRIPNDPLVRVHFFENKYIEFPILENIPGNFPFRAWLYDVNKDGYDEIITFGEAGSSKDYPRPGIEISGYDRNKDEFVTYLDILAVTIDEEKGPDPILYIQNKGVWGFRCLMDSSEYTSLYGIPSLEKDDFIWVFFTWDSNEKKYIESEYIE